MSKASDTTHPFQRRYAVFLSYRHADNKEPGRQWATWLHQALETYEIPGDLAGTTNNRGETVPDSLYPVFRDEEELPADADLTQNIRRALENSALLVVLCSPRAVASRFVADEVRYFKEQGKSENILALLIDGEPNASDDPGKAKSGMAPEMECLPEPLRHGVEKEDGTVDWTARTEPIAADARPDGMPEEGWTTGAAYREALVREGKLTTREINAKVREYVQRLELAKLKVIAGALGVPLGELTRRDKAMQLQKAKRRARTLRRWLGVAGVLAALAVAGGGVALQQKRVALAEKQRAEQTLARSDYLQAVGIVRQEKYNEALPYLARSLRANPHSNPAASLAFDIVSRLPVLRAVVRGDANIRAAFSPDGKETMVVSGSVAQLWDLQAGKPLASITTPHPIGQSIFSQDGKLVATVSQAARSGADQDTTARIWDARTCAPVTPPLAVKCADIRNFTFTPDGGRLIALTEGYGATGQRISQAAQAWDSHTGEPVTPPYLNDSLVFLAFNSDGSLAATAVEGATITELWDTVANKPFMAPLQTGSFTNDAFFSSESSKLVTFSEAGAQVWNLKNGSAITDPLPYEFDIHAAEFNSAGDRLQLVSGYSDDHTAEISIKAWEIKTGKPWGQPPKSAGNVSAAEFSADGNFIATASIDGSGRVWNALTGEAVTPPLKHDNAVISSLFDADAGRVVTASLDRTARLWDARTGAALALPMVHGDIVRTASFSPNGALVLTTSDDAAARIWDARTGSPAASWFEHGVRPTRLCFSADGMRELVVSGATLQVWNARNGSAISPPFQHGKIIYSAAFSPDGSRLVTLSDDKAARIWDTRTGTPAAPPIPVAELNSEPVFNADGTRVLIVSAEGSDWTGRIINTQSGQPVGAPLRLTGSLADAVFSKDGKTLTTVTDILDNSVQKWDADTGLPQGGPVKLNETKVGFTVLSPDGRLVLCAEGGWMARILDVKTGKPVAPPLQHQGAVVSGVFSDDGSRAVTVSYDGTARIWDAKTGAPLGPPIAPIGGVGSFALSADAKLLVTTSSHSIQIWDCATSQPLSTLETVAQDSYSIRSASFTPDGLHLFIETTDDSIRIMDLPPASDPPPWFSDLIEAAAFSRLNDLGVAEPVPAEKILGMERERLASASDDQWEIFGRWLFTDPTERTVSPWSATKMPEYVQELISFNQPDSLKLAIALSYGRPDWQARARAILRANWPGEP